MGVSGFFGKRNLSKLDVALDLPEELFAGTHFPVKITLVNKRRMLPAFLIRVRIGGREVLFPFVPANGFGTQYVDFYFPRRGKYRTELFHISSIYPFNFFIRYRAIGSPFETVVFPQVKKCGLVSSFDNLTLHSGEHASHKAGYDGDMLSIRAYISGDPSKNIHWKASAKTGELKTKEFSTESNTPIFIDFDKVDIREREERISCITYFIVKAFRNNIPVGLKMKDTVYGPGLSKALKISMLRELALYDNA